MLIPELAGRTTLATHGHPNVEDLQRLRRDREILTMAITCLEEVWRLRRNRLELVKARSRGHGNFQSAA
ncbi:MAG: hypothetical protein ABSH56_19120 [Bryobacteraceae bacterium]|jgi:hypothetical protein